MNEASTVDENAKKNRYLCCFVQIVQFCADCAVCTNNGLCYLHNVNCTSWRGSLCKLHKLASSTIIIISAHAEARRALFSDTSSPVKLLRYEINDYKHFVLIMIQRPIIIIT
jgi:hypothetical protein